MSDDQSVAEKAAPAAKTAKNKNETRQELLQKVQKARASRMRHQNPDVDADGQGSKPTRHDKGYGGRPAPTGSVKGGSPMRKKDAG
jgi:hypothetical protein